MAKARGLLGQDSHGVDWGAIGAAIVTLLVGAAGAVGLKRRSASPDKPPDDDDTAVETLRSVVTTLQGENARLWQRNAEQEARYEVLERRYQAQDKIIRNLRGVVVQLRVRLVQAGIDPGESRESGDDG